MPGLCLPRLGCTLLLATALAAQAQSLTNTAALSFGSFTAGTGGTITVNAAGARAKTGSVILVNQGGAAAAAQFTVSGTPGASFTITLPVDGTVFLSNGGSGSMALNGFTSNPPTTASAGLLSGGGTATISIGATLTVSNAQTPGSYSGNFSVTVNYP
jgi:hypothetical protein